VGVTVDRRVGSVVGDVKDPNGVFPDKAAFHNPVNLTFSIKNPHLVSLSFETTQAGVSAIFSNMSVIYKSEIIGTPLDN
jgi:hypothetical protein